MGEITGDGSTNIGVFFGEETVGSLKEDDFATEFGEIGSDFATSRAGTNDSDDVW